MHALLEDPLRGRDHDAAYALGHATPAQHGRRRAHVLDAAVGARADDRLVDGDVAALLHRVRVAGEVRPGNARLDVSGVDLVDMHVLGIRVGVVLHRRTLAAIPHPGTRHVVRFDDAGLAACLDGHVAHRHAALHGETLDGRAGELHRLVERTVHANHADDVQDDVLARGTLGQLAFHLEAQRLRHLEPGAARGEAHARVGGAHARGEGPERAVGAGVRVGTDHEVAEDDGARLGEQRVLDAGAALLPVVGDMLLVGEVAHLLGLLGALDVLVGRVVVGHEAHAVGVEDLLGPQLAKDVDGDGRGDVVGEHEVEVALHELPRPHLVQPRMRRQDLLRHGHGSSHFERLSSLRGPTPRSPPPKCDKSSGRKCEGPFGPPAPTSRSLRAPSGSCG